MMKEWTIGDPGCPYRFVFKNWGDGIIRLRVLDAKTGRIVLPKQPIEHGREQSIGFLPHQCETMIDVFRSVSDKEKPPVNNPGGFPEFDSCGYPARKP